jgi:hypothetical protein
MKILPAPLPGLSERIKMPRYIMTQKALGEDDEEPVNRRVDDFAEATYSLAQDLYEMTAWNGVDVLRKWMELWRDSPGDSPLEVKLEDKEYFGNVTFVFAYDPSQE